MSLSKNNHAQWKTILAGGLVFIVIVIVVLIFSDDCTSAKFFGGEITTKCNPPQPPVAKIYSPNNVIVGKSISFSSAESYHPENVDIESYTWDFGDGTNDSGRSVNHIYQEEGEYIISLTIKDASGLTDSATHKIIVQRDDHSELTVNESLVPVIKTSSGPFGVGKKISFSAAESVGGNIINYRWTFGDGEDENGILVEHKYAVIGSWTVTLTIYDDTGSSATTQRTIKTLPEARIVDELEVRLP